MQITFLGAAREVTGPCFLVEAARRNRQPSGFERPGWNVAVPTPGQRVLWHGGRSGVPA